MKKKRFSVGSLLRWIAMIICIIVIICSSIYLIRIALESYQISQSSKNVSAQYVSEIDSGVSNGEISSDGEETVTAPAYTVDFASLQAASPYAVAWIQVSGIDVINYPVMRYQDDSYFLNHSWDGQDSRYGAIFLEAKNAADLSDDYLLIYGHNMKDGSMFGGLKKYTDASFYEENGGTVTVYLPTETRTYQIFSIRYVNPDDADTYTLWSWQDSSFAAALDRMKNQSIYDTGVDVAEGDNILTLSTCSGEDRLVVHAKLVSSVPVS